MEGFGYSRRLGVVDAPISEKFRRGGVGFTFSTYLSTYITRASIASLAMFSTVFKLRKSATNVFAQKLSEDTFSRNLL